MFKPRFIKRSNLIEKLVIQRSKTAKKQKLYAMLFEILTLLKRSQDMDLRINLDHFQKKASFSENIVFLQASILFSRAVAFETALRSNALLLIKSKQKLEKLVKQSQLISNDINLICQVSNKQKKKVSSFNATDKKQEETKQLISKSKASPSSFCEAAVSGLNKQRLNIEEIYLLRVLNNTKTVLATRKVKKGAKSFKVPFVLDKSRQYMAAFNALCETDAARHFKQNDFYKQLIPLQNETNKSILYTSFQNKAICLKSNFSIPTYDTCLETDHYSQQVTYQQIRNKIQQDKSKVSSCSKVNQLDLYRNQSRIRISKQTIKSHKFSSRVVLQSINALQKKGKAVEKRNMTNKSAKSNRAFINFRWW